MRITKIMRARTETGVRRRAEEETTAEETDTLCRFLIFIFSDHLLHHLQTPNCHKQKNLSGLTALERSQKSFPIQ